MSRNEHISMSVIRRLPRYYRFLYDLKENGITRISSRELAQRMHLTASQIRQDFNCFGEFGQQGYGYVVEQLYHEIGRILGLDRLTPAILIGAGNMGSTIATQMHFEQRGMVLVGIFEKNPHIIGTRVGELTVLSEEQLDRFCETHKPEMAVLCIPKSSAPGVVQKLTELGVKGFWNFSHYDITDAHPDAIVENVHLGDSLMTLSYRLQEKD